MSEPIGQVWQHGETGRMFMQWPGEPPPQATYNCIGPVWLHPPQADERARALAEAARVALTRDEIVRLVRDTIAVRQPGWIAQEFAAMFEHRYDAAIRARGQAKAGAGSPGADVAKA